MADLDDFFAKKDKKKSKVKKFTASELLSSSKSQQEDVAPAPTGITKKAPPKKEEVPAQEPGTEPENPPPRAKNPENEEEEWGEFEQEKERDYSGLKIQRLQIQDCEEDDGEDLGEQELNEEGEPIKKEPTGPWNKLSTQPTSTVKARDVQPVQNLPNTAGGVYIPPSKRNQSSTAPSSRGRTGKKERGAPDLNNQEYFPTLSAASAIEQNNFKLKKFEQTERGFTEAKHSRSHSNRHAVADADQGPRLNLGNKFNALQSEDN